ncbi:MAG: NTP transferase domain-containing protein, partial [Melioribacteraceae bacterium]|nr:NTP transferase domain-containing protein [Melioribacteraceae bacterium]
MDNGINIKISPSGRNECPAVTGLIIAAGLSSRMGKFKPLIEWQDKTFLSSIIDKLKIVCNNIIIVTGNESEKIEKYISEYYSNFENEIRCVNNQIYLEGMFTSLKKGIEASQNS